MRHNKEITVTKEVSEYEELCKFTEEKLSFAKIQQIVFHATEWKHSQVYTDSKRADPVFRRGIIDLIANCNGVSTSQIVKVSKRDYSSVLNSLNSIEDRLDTDRVYRNYLKEIMAVVRENYKPT